MGEGVEKKTRQNGTKLLKFSNAEGEVSVYEMTKLSKNTPRRLPFY